jgi:hypothetical protein
MSTHSSSSSWNTVTITANLVALILMVAGLSGLPGHASPAVASAGTLLLGASSLYAVYRGRRASKEGRNR